MSGKPQIVGINDQQGWHNSQPEDVKQKKNAYRDNSTVLIIPCLESIPSKVVQNWLQIMTPMNSKFVRIFAMNMEVGKAYSETIEAILAHPELSKFKYVWTLEHDNMVAPDALLKLLEDIEEFKLDAVGSLYYTKGEGGKPMCFDDQTEVLTKEGWKLFKDVAYDDEIATLREDGFMEFHRASDKQVYEYKGEMIHWKSQRFDSMVTPDHSVYCKKRGYKDKIHTTQFKRHTASEVENSSRITFKRNADWVGEEQETFIISPDRVVKMDDWLEFLGYYLADGHCIKNKLSPNSKGIDIRKMEGERYDKIASSMDRIGLNTRRNKERVQATDKDVYDMLDIFGKAATKYVPRYIHNLSKRQIKIFLDAIWSCDGSHKDGVYENYFTISPKLADDIQELLLRIGLVGVIGNNTYWNETEQRTVTRYIVSSSHSSFYPIAMKKPKRVDYDGIVYDLTVPNHTLYVRRNGRAIWSGNCYGDINIHPVGFVPFQPQPNTVTRCHGLGMGNTLFRMSMFKNKNLPRPLFETVQRYTPQVGAEAFTQDLKFFLEAGKQGYSFGCSTNTLTGHLDVANDMIW